MIGETVLVAGAIDSTLETYFGPPDIILQPGLSDDCDAQPSRNDPVEFRPWSNPTLKSGKPGLSKAPEIEVSWVPWLKRKKS